MGPSATRTPTGSQTLGLSDGKIIWQQTYSINTITINNIWYETHFVAHEEFVLLSRLRHKREDTSHKFSLLNKQPALRMINGLYHASIVHINLSRTNISGVFSDTVAVRRNLHSIVKTFKTATYLPFLAFIVGWFGTLEKITEVFTSYTIQLNPFTVWNCISIICLNCFYWHMKENFRVNIHKWGWGFPCLLIGNKKCILIPKSPQD